MSKEETIILLERALKTTSPAPSEKDMKRYRPVLEYAASLYEFGESSPAAPPSEKAFADTMRRFSEKMIPHDISTSAIKLDAAIYYIVSTHARRLGQKPAEYFWGIFSPYRQPACACP